MTRKLTLDLGLRYDYSTWYQEQYGRSPNFSPTLATRQPETIRERSLYQATCRLRFREELPVGIRAAHWLCLSGPAQDRAARRLRRRIHEHGCGPDFRQCERKCSASNRSPASNPGAALMTLGQGVTVNGSPLTAAQVAWPNYDSGFYPIGGVVPGPAPPVLRSERGKTGPSVSIQLLSVQREVARDLVVQASYIGNRGIWWPTHVATSPAFQYPVSNLANYNYLSTDILSHYGLNLNNPADLAILLSPIGTAAPSNSRIGFPSRASR